MITRSIPVAGKSRKFIRVEQSTPALDPAVAAYRDAAGIPAESADRINTLLAELRGAGMNPSFLWVGGSAYNQPDQARAVALAAANRARHTANPAPLQPPCPTPSRSSRAASAVSRCST